MTQNEEKIHTLCSSAKADANLCRVVYTVIHEAPPEEKPTLLEAFFNGFQHTPSDHSLPLPNFLNDAEQHMLLRKYGLQVDKQMMDLQDLALPEKEFYSRLWNYISTSPELPNLDARVVALYNCAIDRRMPYYRIDRSKSLSMTQEDFNAYLAAIGEQTLGRMEYILNADFEQKTEQSSLLLEILDSLKSNEERSVFLAQLIAHFHNEMHQFALRDLARSLGRSIPRFPFRPDPEVFSGMDLTDLLEDDDDDDDDDGFDTIVS